MPFPVTDRQLNRPETAMYFGKRSKKAVALATLAQRGYI